MRRRLRFYCLQDGLQRWGETGVLNAHIELGLCIRKYSPWTTSYYLLFHSKFDFEFTERTHFFRIFLPQSNVDGKTSGSGFVCWLDSSRLDPLVRESFWQQDTHWVKQIETYSHAERKMREHYAMLVYANRMCVSLDRALNVFVFNSIVSILLPLGFRQQDLPIANLLPMFRSEQS